MARINDLDNIQNKSLRAAGRMDGIVPSQAYEHISMAAEHARKLSAQNLTFNQMSKMSVDEWEMLKARYPDLFLHDNYDPELPLRSLVDEVIEESLGPKKEGNVAQFICDQIGELQSKFEQLQTESHENEENAKRRHRRGIWVTIGVGLVGILIGLISSPYVLPHIIALLGLQ